MKFHFKLHSQSDAQGDSFALLTAALMHKNALIIPLLRVVRAPYLKLRFMPTRSGGMEHFMSQINLMISGNITIDDLVFPDGRTAMNNLGGDVIYASVCANLWIDGVGALTRVAEDFPMEHLETLRKLGISTEGMPIYPGQTVWDWCLYEYDGRRRWIYRNTQEDSLKRLSPGVEDIPESYYAAKLAFIAAQDVPAQAVISRHLKEKGIPVVMDLNHDEVERNLNLVWDEVLPNTDIFLPSEAEAQTLTGSADHEKNAREFCKKGPGIVIIKLGSKGCMIYEKAADRVTYQPCFEEIKPVDTVGAGDSFCGGFCAGYILTGGDVVNAAHYGHVSSSFTIQDYGSIHVARHTREEAKARLEAYREFLAKRN